MKKNILYIAFLSLLFSSCLEDNGNYDYKDIEDIEISGISESIRCVLLEPNTITPQIRTDIPEGNLEFCWRLGSDTLLKTKDFNYTFKSVPTSSEPLTFDILDKNTNVRYSKVINLNVISPFTSGIAILAEQDGKAKFGFQSFETDKKLYSDLYKDINGEDLGGTPISVKQLVYNDGFTGKRTDRISILLNGAKSPELNGVSLVKEKFYDDEFHTSPIPVFSYINAEYYSMDYALNIITGDGKIYGKVVGSMGTPDDGYYEYPYISASNNNYKLSPTIAHPRQDILNYALDENNHCFVSWTTNSLSSRITPVSFNEVGSISTIDLNNIPGKAIWMGNVKYNTVFYAIVENAGKYTLYQMSFDYDYSAGGFVTNMLACAELPNGTVTSSSCFAIHPKNPYLYIGNGTKLKAINLENLQNINDAVIDIQDYEGDITAIEFAHDSNLLPTVEFYIAVSKDTNSSIYQIDPSLTSHGAIIQSFRGINGRVVSFTRKIM